MVNISYTIWIDENIDNKEYAKYSKELEPMDLLSFRLFKKIDKAINHMKYIEFQETKVIICDRLYNEFIKKFKENRIDMCVASKIIIFTKNKEKIIENNKEYHNNIHLFYAYGGISITFDEIKKIVKR